ncbi:septum formation initiator family protein [Sphingosinicella sp. CPCC 101087]|uniref:FtsB family cell division protein n=1 Tax=Sphingosinicella sp. CPCC 101087 TaxID=2497754 RepID=UPI001FB05C64|nr:septum formation initiator family protein [Sphingosinicella sp. CPCC 101087]
MRRAALPALGLLVIANFLGYAIVGDNGVLSWGDYRRIKAERAVELAQLEAERERLAHRASLLDPRHADPDLAEELVRRELGLVRPDEVIIEIDDPAPPGGH